MVFEERMVTIDPCGVKCAIELFCLVASQNEEKEDNVSVRHAWNMEWNGVITLNNIM
jgi:hypothetical protein